MKKVLTTISVMVVAVLLMCAAASQATAAPDVTVKLLNPPPKNKPLELAVGETRTFDILIKSDEPFVLAIAMTDQYYPGRGIFWHGSDRATQGTEAVLHLTMTGKKSTADLAAVCDWPEPGYCWPEGVAPVSIVVGVRFEGGLAFSEQFPFAAVVP